MTHTDVAVAIGATLFFAALVVFLGMLVAAEKVMSELRDRPKPPFPVCTQRSEP